MSVSRVFFPNTPSGVINLSQRAQLAVHISVGTALSTDFDYFKRYLWDTEVPKDENA